MKKRSNICVILINPQTFECSVLTRYDTLLSDKELLRLYSSCYPHSDILIYVDNNLIHVCSHVSI